MKASFVILHYNQFQEVKDQAVKSIEWALDGYFDYDIVIIDDNSDEYDKVRTLESDKITVLQCPVKKNQSMSRNMGIDASDGDVIWFLDGDDWYSPHALRSACQQIADNPSMDAYGSKLIKNSPRRGNKFCMRIIKFDEVILNAIGTMMMCVSRHYLTRSGIRWDEETYNWDTEDYFFWLQIAGNTTNLLSLQTNGPITYHPLYDGSNSDRKGSVMLAYVIYMMRMCRDLHGLVTTDLAKQSAIHSYHRFVTRYRTLCKYDSLPVTVKKVVDKKISDIVGEKPFYDRKD